MKYLLDTNICIFLAKNRAEVVRRYDENKAFGIAVSTITVSELQFGVYNSANREHNQQNLLRFLVGVDILDYDSVAAESYGAIRADLRRRGTPIGEMDILIAAHAKSLGLTLVTNNTREFSRVSGLLLEDWVG